MTIISLNSFIVLNVKNVLVSRSLTGFPWKMLEKDRKMLYCYTLPHLQFDGIFHRQEMLFEKD